MSQTEAYGDGAAWSERETEPVTRPDPRLLEREQQYRAIFEATSDGLIINDIEHGTIVEANPAACRMHGYSYDEFVGRNPLDIIHPSDHQRFADFIQVVKDGGRFRGRSTDVRKDGTHLYVEVLGQAFTFRGKPHVMAVLRDVTEHVESRRLLELRVEERTRELATLLEVSHSVASTLELGPLLTLILEQLKSVADYTGTSILAFDSNELTILEAGGVNISAEQRIRGLRFDVHLAGGLWGALSRGETVIIDDIRGEAGFAPNYRAIIGENLELPGFRYIRSWLGVPLALKDRVIGMISLSHHTPGFYTEYHATLAKAIANHAALAIENARLFEQVQEKAALEERQRLARELHDSVSQALFSIALGARTARTLLDRDPSQAAQPLDYVLNLAEAGLAEMRALIFELRPESLASEGLVAALQKHGAALKARHAIEVDLALMDEPDVPLTVKEAFYRISQEALHNVVKHARAGHVELRLSCNEKRLTLEIRDNGVGFDPAGEFPGHLGLRSMRERMAGLGGTLEIESAPGHGTQTRASVPLHHAEG